MTPLPNIGAPAQRALLALGIEHLEQVSSFTEKEIAALHGIGPKALRILKEKMALIQKSFKI